MMRNGPKIRLKSAPGRRTVSMTSLPMKEVVRVQLLSSPRNSSTIAFTLGLLLVMLCRGFVGPRHQRREDLVERRPVLARRDNLDTQRVELLDHPRRGRASIIGDHQEATGSTLAHGAYARHLLDARAVERLRRFNF